jgi:hypothetical protein
VTAVAVDAGVPAPDAATAVVVAPADAGTKLASDPKKPPTRPKKPPKTGSASGGNLYDDR